MTAGPYLGDTMERGKGAKLYSNLSHGYFSLRIEYTPEGVRANQLLPRSPTRSLPIASARDEKRVW